MARKRSAGYDDQRDMILQHAAHLFARRGYVGTSMNQVADAAGLSKASLYHYYKDKYALLVQIADGHVSRLGALVGEVEAEGLAPDARVRQLILRIIEEYADAQDAHRVLTEDVRFLEPEDRERILDKERRVVAGYAEAIAAWQPQQAQAGLTKPLTMLLFGMINWMFTWMKPDGELSHAAMAPIVADLFFAGVPGVRAPAAPSEPLKDT
ncbi:MAG: TetR/AcrR family transcriptional regulator [Leptothrix sp. (in: b-proteobacteria)]